jgi:hypothetical protein
MQEFFDQSAVKDELRTQSRENEEFMTQGWAK